MRRILLIAGLCVVGLTAPSQPAAASDRAMDSRGHAAFDMSAAKKKPQRYVQVRETAPAARRGWFDPSLGPDGKPYRNPYPPNICSVDQGYGRFTTCDFHE